MKKFDENNIEFTFSLMSDVHISGSWFASQSKEKLITALDFAGETAKNPVDAYVFSGDFVDCVNSPPNVLLGEKWGNDYNTARAEQSAREFETLREIFKNHIPQEAEIIYCLGNHDSVNCNNTDRFIEEFSSLEKIGDGKNFERMYRSDLEPDLIKKGMRHCVCKGYHFLCIDIMDDYSDTLKFLKKNLDEITAAEPNKYVFIIFHYKTPFTIYSSEVELYKNLAPLDELLKNYPQAVLISGHGHNSIYNERSIMQKEYTSIEGACVSYILIDELTKEPNVENAFKYRASESLLFEIDKNGAVRILRLDDGNKILAKQPWMLSAPNAEGSHLKSYTEKRRETVKKPKFSANAEIKIETADECTKLIIPKVTHNPENVFRYEVKCYDYSGHLTVYNYSSLFCYVKEKEFEMPVIEAVIPQKTEDIYKISVTALDFWMNESDRLEKFIR